VAEDNTQKTTNDSHHKHTETVDEAPLDFSKVKNFFNNNLFKSKKLTSILLTILLILIPIIFTFYIRLLPEGLPQTDAWAQGSVDNFYRSQIAAQVNAQYPNLPQANKDQLISQQLEELRKTNGAQMQQQAQEASQYFKSGFQYQENGRTYTFLGDLDSYFYLRQAKNIEENGMVCDEIKDGQCWDSYLLAPLGGPVSPTLHPYGIVFVHKTLGFFNKSINLMKASFLLPAILAAIACVAAFFIGKRLMNEVAGFFGAMLVALNPMLVTRTLGSDTDIWNIVLPLVIIWIFLESFEAQSIVKKSILAVISGLLLGLFAFAWGGWWYVFDFIIVAVLGYLAVIIIKDIVQNKSLKASRILTSEVKKDFAVIGILFLSTLIFVSLFVSFGAFESAFFSPTQTFNSLKAAAHANLWPNVYTTVAELNEANLSAVVGQTAFGLPWLFALALIGIVLTMIKRNPGWKEYTLIALSFILYLYLVSPTGLAMSPYVFAALTMLPIAAAVILYLIDKDNKVDLKPAFLFTIWFVGMTIASIKGVRFILLLTPIFAIAVGAAVGYLYQYLARIAKTELNINDLAAKIAVFLILCMILITPVKAGISSGENFTPSMTKGWWDSLSKIKQESAPDAIINSWWDFGHWFKYVADRRVTLDGVTQNHPNAHWLGLILQTNNEREALGILRMLDCGSNNAFEEVNKKFNDPEKSENIVADLVVLDKMQGETYLRNLGFTNEEIAVISQYTYCSPSEDYFITSEDMVGKAAVWAHFGLWDFDRAYMINVVRPASFEEGTRLLKERFNYSDSQAASTYYELQALQSDREMNDWIAPWPNYFTGDWINACREVNQTNIIGGTSNITSDSPSIACALNIVVSQDATGGRNVLEGAVYNYENPEQSMLFIVGVNSAGQRTGSAQAVPTAFVIVSEDDITRNTMQNVSFPFDIIIDKANNRAMVAAPELSESLFTKLFFLDGKHTNGFEKFSDLTDITGQRIIVWKVNWNALEDN
jgi:dolichyl-phosphooligosaccharide-protein glycotransferase